MLNTIFKKYRETVVKSGSEFRVPKDLCLSFLKDCRLHRVAILGIEGFKSFPDNSIQPQIDEIADFSALSELKWDNFVDKSIGSAENFISNLLEKDQGYSDLFYFELCEIDINDESK